MKMRWFDKVLLVLGGLILLALGVFVVLFASNIIRFAEISMDKLFSDAWQWMPLFILAGALLILLGIRIAFRSLWRRRVAQSRYYAVQSVDAGSIHISMQAIDHLVHKCIQIWPEILTTHVAIHGQQEAVTIRLRLTLRSDVRIPELIADVRAEIKDYVEECSGVKVERVEVIIEATKEAPDSRSVQRSFPIIRSTPSLPEGKADQSTTPDEVASKGEQRPCATESTHEMEPEEAENEPVSDRNPIHISHSIGWTESIPITPSDVLSSGNTEGNGQTIHDELVELDAYVDEVEETEADLPGNEEDGVKEDASDA